MSFKSDFRELMRFEDQAEKCLRCGLCLYQCPIYRKEHDESVVARGRNKLITELVNKEADFTKEFNDNLSLCLVCNRCSMFCPAGIHTDQLILALRADLVRQRGLSFTKKIAYRQVIPHRQRFTLLLKTAARFQELLPKYEGDFKRLPFFLSPLGKGRYAPHIASTPLIEQVPSVVSPPQGTEVRRRVGFFIGCAFNFIWPEIGRSIINFLVKNGIEVVIPKEQGCCGMPVSGAGDFETARVLADNTASIFSALDIVVTGCATCGSALKHYPVYLADTEERTKSYGEFSAKVRDFAEFLVDDLRLPASAYGTRHGRVTYHDPCHLARYQNIVKQPRKILKSINGLEFVEMDAADDCCGMGGAFSIYHYQLSQSIADHKIESIKKTNADIVATTCPGCMVQIWDGLLRHKMPQKVFHLAQLLDGEI
ncbi:Lactate utilization protein A [subsurface metagenome]